MATLLLIRPEAQSRRLVEVLAARGLRPRVLVSPVVKIRARRVTLPEGADLVLTSQNAVTALRGGRRRAWCVGDSTAAAAREAGLDAVSAAGDVETLLALLTAERPGPLVHVRGAHTTGDLTARLRAAGLQAQEVVAYDQVARPLTQEASDLLAADAAVVLPLYSSRSAALVAGHDGDWRAAVHAVAISPAAAEAFRRPARVSIAADPTGEAMKEEIARTLAAAGVPRLVDRGGAG